MNSGYYWVKFKGDKRWHIAYLRKDGDFTLSYEFSAPYAGIYPASEFEIVHPAPILPPD